MRPIRDRSIALALFLGAVALYRTVPTTAFVKDAVMLVEAVQLEGPPGIHPLFLVLARPLRRLSGLPADEFLLVYSAIAAAAAVALVFAGLRAFGCARGPSAAASLFVAFAPATVYWGSHIEEYTVHLFFVGLTFALAGGASRAGTSGWQVALVATSLAGVVFSHASGLLAVPPLAWLASRRLAGRSRTALRALALAAFLAVAGVLGAVALAGAAIREGQGPEGFFGTRAFLIHQYANWTADPAAWLRFLEVNLLRAGGALAIGGLSGVVVLAARREPEARPLALWIALYGAVFAAWGNGVDGQWLLPTYPALALGAARLFDLLARRAPGFPVAAAVAVLVGLQALWGLHRPLLGLPTENPFRWAESVCEGTGDRGLLLTAGAVHPYVALKRTRLEVLDLGWIGGLGPDPSEGALRAFGDLVETRMAAGTAVYLDAAVLDEVRSYAPLGRAVDVLRDRFVWDPIAAAPFRGYALKPKAR